VAVQPRRKASAGTGGWAIVSLWLDLSHNRLNALEKFVVFLCREIFGIARSRCEQ
jgi:hypothetical protein